MATRKTMKNEDSVEVLETVEVELAVAKPKTTKKTVNNTPFHVQEGQTQISSRNYFNFLPNTKRVVVENLGGGELYVGTENLEFVLENLVKIGETKEITGGTPFFVGAPGRPFYRISHFE